MKPRILIVDDHEIVREGIRMLISKSGEDWEICGEASNATLAIEAVKNLQPDIVVLDITMPGISGLEAARRINGLGLSARILMFTMHEFDRLSAEVREAGAQGYVLKSQAARDLVLAIQNLIAGNTFFGAPPEPAPKEQKKSGRGPRFFETLSLLRALFRSA